MLQNSQQDQENPPLSRRHIYFHPTATIEEPFPLQTAHAVGCEGASHFNL